MDINTTVILIKPLIKIKFGKRRAAHGKCYNPIASSGLTYDASLSKIIPITGNHSLQIKGTSYGDRYPHYAEYSENTSSFAALYRFNNANTTVSLEFRNSN
ncbi:DUF560 domain-containing protein [Providencia rettgeri]|nr:DUF560 domain-containing protein [Providencia rettgeri]